MSTDPKPKRKSQRRFEQVNLLCDEVLQNLPTPTHALVLLIGWRHANEKRVFRKSTTELARFAGLKRRRMQAVLDQLIEVGALKVVKESCGTIPTCYQITGQPRRSRGALGCTPSD